MAGKNKRRPKRRLRIVESINVNKILVGLLFSILMTVAGWWINRVENSMEVTTGLYYKDKFLNGEVKQAPVQAPVAPPPAAAK